MTPVFWCGEAWGWGGRQGLPADKPACSLREDYGEKEIYGVAEVAVRS